MTNQEIFELLSRFESSCIHTMKLSSGVFSLELSKERNGFPADSPAVPAVQAASARPVSSEPSITAPLAGVFYAASQPGAEPYVRAGDQVSKGQTVCLMEAMKMISEIPAPCDCIITAVLKENGTLAAFDEPLFRYQPC